jgi:putative transcriptional regulator
MRMDPDASNLTNHFLIAMPGLSDPTFERTVTYLCQHNAEGALGIIVNRPSEMRLGDVLKELDIPVLDDSLSDQPVYLGGPVQPERGFVLHAAEGAWKSTLRITDELSLTTSRDILEALGRGDGPKRAILALGYAGWGSGQLEQEIGQNAWLNAEAKDTVIFDRPPEKRWRAAAELVGVDISLLTLEAGHA